MPCYCELCGREIPDERMCRTVMVEGVVMTVCPQCYNRLMKKGAATPPPRTTRPPIRTWGPKPRTSRPKPRSIPRRILEEEYEVVEDYAERIRRARQRLGWTQKVLAQKVREKENVIKRIEAGRLKPSIELARRLEKVLGITLLEPIADEVEFDYGGRKGDDYFTIGDLIRIRKEGK